MIDEKPTQGGDGNENIHPREGKQGPAGDRLVAEGWRNNTKGCARHEEVRAESFVKIITFNKHTSFGGDRSSPLLYSPQNKHLSGRNNKSLLLGIPPLPRNTKQSQPTVF